MRFNYGKRALTIALAAGAVGASTLVATTATGSSSAPAPRAAIGPVSRLTAATSAVTPGAPAGQLSVAQLLAIAARMGNVQDLEAQLDPTGRSYDVDVTWANGTGADLVVDRRTARVLTVIAEGAQNSPEQNTPEPQDSPGQNTPEPQDSPGQNTPEPQDSPEPLSSTDLQDGAGG